MQDIGAKLEKLLNQASKDARAAGFELPPRPAHVVDELRVCVVGGRGLRPADGNRKADPFCEVALNADEQVQKTRVQRRTLEPRWEEELVFDDVTVGGARASGAADTLSPPTYSAPASHCHHAKRAPTTH